MPRCMKPTIRVPFAAGLRVMVGSSSSLNVFMGYTEHLRARGQKDGFVREFAAGVGLSIFPGGIQP